MRFVLAVLLLLVAAVSFAQTADEQIQAEIDELTARRDVMEANKVATNQASLDLASEITALQSVIASQTIGDDAKAACEKNLKRLQRIDIPSSAEVDAEIAAIAATIAELQSELP